MRILFYRFSQNGLSIGYRGLFFAWPWRRRAIFAGSEKIRLICEQDRQRMEAHLRKIGASEQVIFHTCHWIGTPLDSRWIRFKAWLAADFGRLRQLRIAKQQKAQKVGT